MQSSLLPEVTVPTPESEGFEEIVIGIGQESVAEDKESIIEDGVPIVDEKESNRGNEVSFVVDKELNREPYYENMIAYEERVELKTVDLLSKSKQNQTFEIKKVYLNHNNDNCHHK